MPRTSRWSGPARSAARLWLPGDAERWCAEFIDDGPEDVLRFWCQECWLREFDGV